MENNGIQRNVQDSPVSSFSSSLDKSLLVDYFSLYFWYHFKVITTGRAGGLKRPPV